MKDIANCEGCIFNMPTITDEGEPHSKCRRYPPQVFLDHDGEIAQTFPDAYQSCGEYRAEKQPLYKKRKDWWDD